MRNSVSRQFAVALLSIACGTFYSGCDAVSNAKQAQQDLESARNQESAQSSEDAKAQSRETKDAKQVARETAGETASQDKTDATAPDFDNADTDDEVSSGNPEPEKQTIEIPASWTRLGKKEEIWIDTKAKEVIIAGRVCLNQGPLEMFICPQHTKEHESVISANATALQVHLALTALGADPGKATSWDPEYRAAYGPTIQITLKWQDHQSKETKTVLANQWIRDFKTKKPMEHLWVFGGSQFWEDPDSKEKIYYGDSGELICLSNFSTATIDLNVESSQSNDGLLFEAFTENIPPLGTKVYAIIKPGERIEPTEKPKAPTDSESAKTAEKQQETGDETSDQ